MGHLLSLNTEEPAASPAQEPFLCWSREARIIHESMQGALNALVEFGWALWPIAWALSAAAGCNSACLCCWHCTQQSIVSI